MIRGIARKYFEGKTCIFCDKYGLYRLADNRVKCKYCKKYYSLSKLKKDLQVLYYFYLEISARKTSKELKFEKYNQNIKNKETQLKEEMILGEEEALLLTPIDKGYPKFVKEFNLFLMEIIKELKI